MRNQYKLLQEAYKQILENGSSAYVEGIKSRIAAGEDVVGQLNKTLPVIGIVYMENGGEVAEFLSLINTPRKLPSTAIPIYTGVWYDPFQQDTPSKHIILYILNTSEEAITFVKDPLRLYGIHTLDHYASGLGNNEEMNRAAVISTKFLNNIYDTLGIDGYKDPILPPKNWKKIWRALNKDNPGIEMDI
jgi:hypothetical protein